MSSIDSYKWLEFTFESILDRFKDRISMSLRTILWFSSDLNDESVLWNMRLTEREVDLIKTGIYSQIDQLYKNPHFSLFVDISHLIKQSYQAWINCDEIIVSFEKAYRKVVLKMLKDLLDIEGGTENFNFDFFSRFYDLVELVKESWVDVSKMDDIMPAFFQKSIDDDILRDSIIFEIWEPTFEDCDNTIYRISRVNAFIITHSLYSDKSELYQVEHIKNKLTKLLDKALKSKLDLQLQLIKQDLSLSSIRDFSQIVKYIEDSWLEVETLTISKFYKISVEVYITELVDLVNKWENCLSHIDKPKADAIISDTKKLLLDLKKNDHNMSRSIKTLKNLLTNLEWLLAWN